MPSVVLLTVDCLRADHVGCYGYERPTTPNIDTFADEATVFEYGYSNCPGTRWAFQSIHTGLQAARIRGLGIPADYPHVLARMFNENGYRTAGFAHNGFVSREYGYDSGFDTYYGVQEFANNVHPLRRLGKRVNDVIASDFFTEKVLSASDRVLDSVQEWNEGAYRPDVPDTIVTDRAVDWLATQQDAGREFFLWIHFMDAHTPYGRYDDHLTAIRGDAAIEHTIHPGNEGLVSPGTDPEPRAIDTYDANIRSVDQQIGRILDRLDAETVVAITGDHGEEFGRYNPFHTESFYSSMTQIPLIIRTAGIDTGRVQEYPVQHLDIPPTLASAAEMEVPDAYEGAALQRVDRTVEDPIFFSLAEDRLAVQAGEWKLLRDEGSVELYHTPHGHHDGDQVENEEKQRKLLELLSEFGKDLKRNKIGGGKGNPGDEDLSPTVQENLAELGYIE